MKKKSIYIIMSSIKILIVILSFICIILVICMFNKTEEPFIPVSDMVSNKPFLTYNKDNIIDNAGIILKNNSTDSFKQIFNEPDVIEPVVPVRIAKENEPFKDNIFIRDKGVTTAMSNKEKKNDIEYIDVENAILNFKQPIDSADKLSYKNINDFSKDELDNTPLSNIFDQMSAKIVESISREEAERIGGKPIIINTLTGLYNPVYTSIDGDDSYEMNNRLFNIDYKFKGFSQIPSGSLI